jgi:hypothetical protein
LFTWVITGFLKDVALEFNIRTISDAGENSTTHDDQNSKFDAWLIHQLTNPQKIYSNQSSWWWQYDLIFLCFWGDGNRSGFHRDDVSVGAPINDEQVFQKIQWTLKKYLAEGFGSLSDMGIREATRGLLAFSQENPINSDTPFIDHPITSFPTQSPYSVDQVESGNSESLEPSSASVSSDAQKLLGDVNKQSTYSTQLDPQYWVRFTTEIFIRGYYHLT